jgi:hypothetical protein
MRSLGWLAEASVPDIKTCRVAACRRPFHFDLGDLSRPRANAQDGEQLLERRLCPFGDDLDSAVWEIASPASHASQPSLINCEVAIPHALHSSEDAGHEALALVHVS